jgi:hypothetical protein
MHTQSQWNLEEDFLRDLFGLRMYIDSRTRVATQILMFQYIK